MQQEKWKDLIFTFGIFIMTDMVILEELSQLIIDLIVLFLISLSSFYYIIIAFKLCRIISLIPCIIIRIFGILIVLQLLT